MSKAPTPPADGAYGPGEGNVALDSGDQVATSHINHLPPEIRGEIFSYVGRASAPAIRQVCRAWYPYGTDMLFADIAVPGHSRSEYRVSNYRCQLQAIADSFKQCPRLAWACRTLRLAFKGYSVTIEHQHAASIVKATSPSVRTLRLEGRWLMIGLEWDLGRRGVFPHLTSLAIADAICFTEGMFSLVDRRNLRALCLDHSLLPQTPDPVIKGLRARAGRGTVTELTIVGGADWDLAFWESLLRWPAHLLSLWLDREAAGTISPAQWQKVWELNRQSLRRISLGPFEWTDGMFPDLTQFEALEELTLIEDSRTSPVDAPAFQRRLPPHPIVITYCLRDKPQSLYEILHRIAIVRRWTLHLGSAVVTRFQLIMELQPIRQGPPCQMVNRLEDIYVRSALTKLVESLTGNGVAFRYNDFVPAWQPGLEDHSIIHPDYTNGLRDFREETFPVLEVNDDAPNNGE